MSVFDNDESEDQIMLSPGDPQIVIYYQTRTGGLIKLSWVVGNLSFTWDMGHVVNSFNVLTPDNPYVTMAQMIDVLDRWIETNDEGD